MTVIKNGRIIDVVKKEAYVADILVKDGKIAAIGTGLEDETVVDASGMNVYPGFVDAHSHSGQCGYGIGFEGTDYNEVSDPLTPHLRSIDSINPMCETLELARNSGVTTIATGQGSANAIGGQWTTIKTVGKCVDDMVVRDGVAMKCALGENPKRCYNGKGNGARMSTAAHIREMVYRTRDYKARKDAANGDITKMPAFDQKCEAMIPVIEKKMPLKIHAHQANDIITAIRLGKDLDVKITLEHVTEGHLIADVLARYPEIPMAVGPTLTHASKFELKNKSWTTAGVLAAKGCQVSIITDAPFCPQNYLTLSASLCVEAGMDEWAALQAITINPAKHLGIEDRVGSLEVGKDADFVIVDGTALCSAPAIKNVFINGQAI